MLPASALAQGITIQGMVQKGDVLEKNVILSGPTVVMDGVINGDLVAVGDNITINGQVNGSLVMMGKTLILNSQVTGSVYSAGAALQVGPQADVSRDVYFVGGTLETQPGSTVNRDLNVLSLETSLDGMVGRDVNAVVGPINLAKSAYNLIKGEEWEPRGILRPSSHLVPAAPAQYPVLTAGPNIQFLQQVPAVDQEAVKAWAAPFLKNLFTLIILALFVNWLTPVRMRIAGTEGRAHPWRTMLYGLLIITVGSIVAFLATMLVAAIAIFLNWITLQYLAFLFALLGLFVIGLALAVFWLAIEFFSKLVVAYLIGAMLFNRFFPKQAQSRVLPLVVGVIIYALLASIPFLSLPVVILSTLFGLGAIWIAILPRPVVYETAPAPVTPLAADGLDMGVLPQN